MKEEQQIVNAVKELHEKLNNFMVVTYGEAYLIPFDEKNLVNIINDMATEIDNIT